MLQTRGCYHYQMKSYALQKHFHVFLKKLGKWNTLGNPREMQTSEGVIKPLLQFCLELVREVVIINSFRLFISFKMEKTRSLNINQEKICEFSIASYNKAQIYILRDILHIKHIFHMLWSKICFLKMKVRKSCYTKEIFMNI